jgi:glycine/D-amino acid oxidase-like deaminating enzyme
MPSHDADVIVIGAGLAGLAATAELVDAGRRVILLDQEPEQSLGGQAFWSFGGLFFVDSPEQRRMRIKDSAELAWQDWQGSAAFDREEDHWPRQWAEAYVHFASGEKRAWLHELGFVSSPSSDGPNAVATWPPDTATRYPASTSPGAPARGWSRRSPTGCARASAGAWCHCVSGIASTG